VNVDCGIDTIAPVTTLSPMAMGKRKRRAKQTTMWVATQDLPRSAAHPFYTRLNQILDQHDFDGYVEGLCQRFLCGRGAAGPGAGPLLLWSSQDLAGC
jgi:hypothetical protein